jgi:hypothetical protein
MSNTAAKARDTMSTQPDGMRSKPTQSKQELANGTL